MIRNNKVTSKNVVIADSGELDHEVDREELNHQISMPEDLDGTLQFHDPKEPKKPGHLRFVVISDTHIDDECFKGVPEGDVLIHAGDFSYIGHEDEIKKFAA